MSYGVVTDRVTMETCGEGQVLDLTQRVAAKVSEHALREGHVLVFVSGSTGAVTTIEYEPGLARDLPELFERIAPQDLPYHHEAAWHDGNGHSHVRASLLGPSLAVPVAGGRLLLGTWQQIVLVDFDNRPRRREVIVQMHGEIAPAR